MTEETPQKPEPAADDKAPAITFADQVKAARPGILAALDALAEAGAANIAADYSAHDNATDRLLDLGHLFHVLASQLFQHKPDDDDEDDWKPHRFAETAWADLLRHAEIAVEVSEDYEQASVDGPVLVQELASIDSANHLEALIELVKQLPPRKPYTWGPDPKRCLDFLTVAHKERGDMDAGLRDRQNYAAAHTLAIVAAAALERQLARVDRELGEATAEREKLRGELARLSPSPSS